MLIMALSSDFMPAFYFRYLYCAQYTCVRIKKPLYFVRNQIANEIKTVWTHAIARFVNTVLYCVIATKKNFSPRSYFYVIGLFAMLAQLILVAIEILPLYPGCLMSVNSAYSRPNLKLIYNQLDASELRIISRENSAINPLLRHNYIISILF